MARLIYSERAFADLEHLADFLLDSDPAAAVQTVALITEAVSILERHPMIGCQVSEEICELIISRGGTGYVALDSFEAGHDVVLTLAIRHQREAGYAT